MNVKSMMPNIKTFLGDYQHSYDKIDLVYVLLFPFKLFVLVGCLISIFRYSEMISTTFSFASVDTAGRPLLKK